MKRLMLLTLASISLTLAHDADPSQNISSQGAAPTHEKIALDSSILKFIDGVYFNGAPLINVGEIFTFARNLIAMQYGAKSQDYIEKITELFDLEFPRTPVNAYNKCSSGIGIIWCVDGYYSIKELVAMEESGTRTRAEIDAALDHMATHFEKFSADYVKEIQVGKKFMVQLIENWSIMRNRQDTILLNWSKIEQTEKDALYQTLTTAKLVDIFLTDLLMFLADLVQNCPKSHKAYRDSLKASGSPN